MAHCNAAMKLLLEQAMTGESSQVLVRSKLRAASRRMGFSDAGRERVELVGNEMMTNQIKFAQGGLVQVWETDAPALDLFALDYGPGVANLPAALADGFTTAGTLGKGLGAIRRLAQAAEFYTLPRGMRSEAPWHGMAVWARFRPDGGDTDAAFHAGCYLRAYHDDLHNGDSIRTLAQDGGLRWLHLDGLGHGAEAAAAVAAGNDLLDAGTPLCELMQTLSARLKGSRGAVGMVCETNGAERRLRVCGVGDMSAYWVCNGERRAINFAPGILGHAHAHFEEVVYAFPPQTLVLTASDGIRHNWGLQSFPGLWRLHPQMIALFLGQVLGRSSDDKSIFSVRTLST